MAELLAFDATAEVGALLASIGRTEDIRFSPDGTRLAIADFGRDRVVVLDITLSDGDDGPGLAMGGGVEISTDAFALPHGVDWIDDDHLVVGNRNGRVVVVPVPGAEPGAVRSCRVEVAEGAIAGDDGGGPGSVACRREGSGVDVYVCNNWRNTIARHEVVAGPSATLGDGHDHVRRHIDLPDGVAVDAGGRWLAVSVHNQHVVQVYDLGDDRGPDDIEPVGVLRGITFPHGLCFTPDGRHLLVADAGRPELRRYDAPDGDWRRVAYPSASIVVLDEETFERGHGREDEGGPKGIDIHPSGTVLAVTCEEAALRFFPVGSMLGPGDDSLPIRLGAVEREVRVLATHSQARADRDRFEYLAAAAEVREHDARAQTARVEEANRQVVEILESRVAARAAREAELESRLAEAEAVARAALEQVAAMEGTRLWRAAAPARSLYARWRQR